MSMVMMRRIDDSDYFLDGLFMVNDAFAKIRRFLHQVRVADELSF